MMATDHLGYGFFRSSTVGPKTAWNRLTSDMRRRLIACGWPFTALLSVPAISNFFDLCAFVHVHRRWPNFRKTGYLNDYLHVLKATRENLDLRRKTSDKELAKQFVSDVLGRNCSVPTLDVIRDGEAVTAYRFPPQSIVKPTHMSGVVFRCGAQQPTPAERAVMQSWFQTDYGLITGEWNYRDLQPKIIVEPFLSLNGGASHDLRFYVCQGKVRLIEVYCGRYRQPTLKFFDSNWNAIPGMQAAAYPRSPTPIPRPKRLARMRAAAERIGQQFSFVRVDFFTDFEDTFYVGELTHFSANCRLLIAPVSAERFFLKGIA